MHTHNEDAIRDRAYALWLEAGAPEGNDWQFWHEAERELAANGNADMAETNGQATDEQQGDETSH